MDIHRGAPFRRTPPQASSRHAKHTLYLTRLLSSSTTPTSHLDALYARRVEHHAARAGDRARRQVLAELCAHDAIVAVRPAHLTPNRAELAAVDLLLRLVNVGDTARMKKRGRRASARGMVAKGTDAAGRAKARAAPQQAPHGESCPRVLSGAPPAASKAPRRPQRQHDQP